MPYALIGPSMSRFLDMAGQETIYVAGADE
jgi:hypothetical protein